MSTWTPPPPRSLSLLGVGRPGFELKTCCWGLSFPICKMKELARILLESPRSRL